MVWVPRAGDGSGGADVARHHLADEDVALDLAGRREGELLEELQALGQLVGGDAVAEEGDELLEPRRRAARLRHEAKAVALAEPRVGDADDRRVEHGGVRVEDLLDLAREE